MRNKKRLSFISCKFNAGKVPIFSERGTLSAYLNISYRNFVTRSDIYALGVVLWQ